MADFDYIIVGSGAGGSAAAYGLAQTGKRVLVIEKGTALPTDGSTLDFERVIAAGQFKSKEPWLDKDDNPFVPEEYFNVGGKTKWYGAALLRYGRGEFESDAGFRCLPWPIRYGDLAPYYDQAERLLGVRQFDVEPDLETITRRMNGSTWQPQALPLGLSAEILDDNHEAAHFDGFASARGFKADADTALLQRIRAAGNVTIMSGDPVQGLIADATDPACIAGVSLASSMAVTGGCTLLAAGAMHSPRLLQKYLHRTGLDGRLPSAPWVGRYFKRHLLTAMLAFSPSRKTDVLRKTAVWLSETCPHSSIQPLGFGGDVIGSLLPGFLPRWSAKSLSARAYGFFLQTEDGSDPNNRVLAEGHGNNLPRLDYDAARTPEAVREHRRMISSFRLALFKAGYVSGAKSIGLAGTAHACGTLIAGADPQRSVVDANGRAHGFDNLYVVDGSILPRSSRVNPSLSIYAWALRVADILAGKPRA